MGEGIGRVEWRVVYHHRQARAQQPDETWMNAEEPQPQPVNTWCTSIPLQQEWLHPLSSAAVALALSPSRSSQKMTRRFRSKRRKKLRYRCRRSVWLSVLFFWVLLGEWDCSVLPRLYLYVDISFVLICSCIFDSCMCLWFMQNCSLSRCYGVCGQHGCCLCR